MTDINVLYAQLVAAQTAYDNSVINVGTKAAAVAAANANYATVAAASYPTPLARALALSAATDQIQQAQSAYQLAISQSQQCLSALANIQQMIQDWGLSQIPAVNLYPGGIPSNLRY